MKIKASKGDVIWSYIGTFFSLSSSFLLLPFVLIKLSGSELGLWYIFLAINGLVSLFDFGFDPTFARNIAYAWGGATKITKLGAEHASSSSHLPNYQLLAVLVATSRKLYRRISTLALVLISTFGTFYIIHISHALRGTPYLVAWFIFCFGLFLNLYFGYFSALLRGIGAVGEINRATMLAKISQLVVSAVLLMFNLGLIAVAIGFVVNGILFRVICSLKFDKYQGTGNKIKKYNSTVTSNQVKQVYQAVSFNAFRDGGVAIANYLSTQATSLIASSFLSLSMTGEYSILLQFSNAIVNISATIIFAYHPTLQSAFQRGDTETELTYIGRGLTAYYAVFILGVIGMVTVGFPVLHLFKPSMHFDILLFLGIIVYTFLWQQQSASASYIANTNRVPYVGPFILGSLLGVGLSLVLVRYTSLGAWGLVVGPGIVQLLFNNWYWLYFRFKELGTNWFQIVKIGTKSWKNTIRDKQF